MSRALAFLDESGDEGGRISRGASPLFVVGLVVFPNATEAARGQERIEQLRAELHLPAAFEFHFHKNRPEMQAAFLRAIAPLSFTYHAVVVRKRELATSSLPLYLEACASVCRLAEPALSQALHVRDEYSRYSDSDVRKAINAQAPQPLVGRVRSQRSRQNSLLQLADYVTAVHRHVTEDRERGEELSRLLRAREGRFDLWLRP